MDCLSDEACGNCFLISVVAGLDVRSNDLFQTLSRSGRRHCIFSIGANEAVCKTPRWGGWRGV
jgi:hypothetical protein